MLRTFVEPVGAASFSVTDDAIVDFLAQRDDHIGQEGLAQQDDDIDDEGEHGALFLQWHFSKDLFKRILEDEDLRGFAQHLSHRFRGRPNHKRIYDFPGEQHGAPTAMLTTYGTLEVTRAPRSYPYFLQSDE
ncbi:hypothetical protein AAVH_31710 [Aphelenchoides avenae]|nr:hypothetical protein AAVH_31710 [Aphelenchus avenae]